MCIRDRTKAVAAGFANAKLKVKEFNTFANSSTTQMVSKFSGSMAEWTSYLQGAIDAGKVSASAGFKFIEDESGQMTLSLMGDAGEWADFMVESGRISASAYDTLFKEIGITGEYTFGALTDSAMSFQSTLNSLKAPSLTIGAPLGIDMQRPASMDGFAHGGSFIVGGSGGTDSTPVGFMATPGEKVSIQTPEQQNQAIVINIESDGKGLDQFIRVVSDDHRVQVNRSGVRPTERVY